MTRRLRPGKPPPEATRQVQLRVGNERPGRAIVRVGAWFMLGRRDISSAVQPNFDLTPFGAAEHGVSRLHAALRYEARELMVEDLGSTNGTRLNGLPLQPGTAYRLRDNDELELGSLRVTVEL